MSNSLPNAKVITARGPLDPDALGKVMLHEHRSAWFSFVC